MPSYPAITAPPESSGSVQTQIPTNDNCYLHHLVHDNLGKVTSILDSTNSTYNQGFSYDGLGQLVTASGKWGAGSYDYKTSA